MRLVSALYDDNHPFYSWNVFDEYEVVNTPDDLREGDVLVIWGGGDISPVLYGKPCSIHGGGQPNGPSRRDSIEWGLMSKARDLGIPIIGVCRGGQMLTALVGGHLIQHVHGHMGMHPVDTSDGQTFQVNSIHHQMMVPPKNGSPFEMVGWCSEKLSDEYWDVVDGQDVKVEMDLEPEFIYYPEVKGYAIQWHPEGLSVLSPANRYIKKFFEDHQ